MALTINLLQCDVVQDRFRHISGDYSDMFIALFARYRPEITVAVYDVRAGQYPPLTADGAGFVCSGSSASVYQPAPWIETLKAYVVQLHQERRKFVGVCFGHQLLAAALGGEVRQSARGWGVGVQTVDVAVERAWMAPPQRQFAIPVSYQDQVETLPPGAVRLAGNAHCPNYMIAVGDHFLGIQGHPEASSAYMKALLLSRTDRISAPTVAQALQSFAQPIQPELIASWIVHFLAGSSAAQNR